MEPDYAKYAQDVIERLRLNRPLGAAAPGQSKHVMIINEPKGCVFYFGTSDKPPTGDDAASPE